MVTWHHSIVVLHGVCFKCNCLITLNKMRFPCGVHDQTSTWCGLWWQFFPCLLYTLLVTLICSDLSFELMCCTEFNQLIRLRFYRNMIGICADFPKAACIVWQLKLSWEPSFIIVWEKHLKFAMCLLYTLR